MFKRLLSFHPTAIYSRPIPPDAAYPTSDRFTARLVSDPDDPAVVEAATRGDLESFRRHLSEGQQLWVVHEGDRLAGRVWVTTRPHREGYTGLNVRLFPGEAWASGAFTEPEFRQQGVGVFRAGTMTAELAARGVHTLYVSIEEWNVASQRLSGRVGFDPVQRLVFVRFLRTGFALPGSLRPRGGPLSRRRRPSTADATEAVTVAAPDGAGAL